MWLDTSQAYDWLVLHHGGGTDITAQVLMSKICCGLIKYNFPELEHDKNLLISINVNDNLLSRSEKKLLLKFNVNNL